MRTIKVPVSKLLATVTENRANHRAIFEKAQEGYRRAAIEELDKMLAEARDGKRIRREVELVEPLDQTEDYDRVIAMLEMTDETHVELSEHEFSCYVLDKWAWMEQFTASNISSGYLTR